MPRLEIRPAAVSAQITAKSAELTTISDSVVSAKERVNEFINDTQLQGESFDSARTKFDQYPILFAGIEYMTTIIKAADSTVVNALSEYFGLVPEVSEAKFVTLRDLAKEDVAHWANKLANTKFMTPWQKTMWQNSLDRARGHQVAAEAKIQDIHNYSSETQYAHNSYFGEMSLAIEDGINALSAAAYDPVKDTWSAPNNAWITRLQEAVSLGVEGVHSIFNHGELNYDLCAALWAKPFELWSDLEKEYMGEAIQLIFADQNAEALTGFINSAYTFTGGTGGLYLDTYDERFGFYVGQTIEATLSSTFQAFAWQFFEESQLDWIAERETADTYQNMLLGNLLIVVASFGSTAWVPYGSLPFDNFSFVPWSDYLEFEGLEGYPPEIPEYIDSPNSPFFVSFSLSINKDSQHPVQVDVASFNIIEFLAYQQYCIQNGLTKNFDAEYFSDKVGEIIGSVGVGSIPGRPGVIAGAGYTTVGCIGDYLADKERNEQAGQLSVYTSAIVAAADPKQEKLKCVAATLDGFIVEPIVY
ncbi:MAG: hypothetical protein FWE41_03420 [Coriobacteriia bacterium]|nr:hypothetical protein [Coriobacteriia bacterium]MCL2749709.1 hypothetical protein [Coriobacteriia bacterium]